jgi:hypothetical protein
VCLKAVDCINKFTAFTAPEELLDRLPSGKTILKTSTTWWCSKWETTWWIKISKCWKSSKCFGWVILLGRALIVSCALRCFVTLWSSVTSSFWSNLSRSSLDRIDFAGRLFFVTNFWMWRFPILTGTVEGAGGGWGSSRRLTTCWSGRRHPDSWALSRSTRWLLVDVVVCCSYLWLVLVMESWVLMICKGSERDYVSIDCFFYSQASFCLDSNSQTSSDEPMW